MRAGAIYDVGVALTRGSIVLAMLDTERLSPIATHSATADVPFAPLPNHRQLP